MPQGTRVARCVNKVKAKGSGVNAYAVCQASTGQSYATGKPLKKQAESDHLKHMRAHGLHK